MSSDENQAENSSVPNDANESNDDCDTMINKEVSGEAAGKESIPAATVDSDETQEQNQTLSKEVGDKASEDVVHIKGTTNSSSATTHTSKANNTNPKEQNANPRKEKVKVHFVAVGSAPMMKKTKFLISGKEQFGVLQERMRKMLKVKNASANGTNGNTAGSGASLFMYINQAFVPSPEDLVGDLGNLFSVRDELQIHYSLQEAWG